LATHARCIRDSCWADKSTFVWSLQVTIAVGLGRRAQSLDRFGEAKPWLHVLDSHADRLALVHAGHEEREPLDAGDTVTL